MLSQTRRFRRTAANLLKSHVALAFLPALSLGAFWLGGEAALMAVAMVLPVVIFVTKDLSLGPLVPRDAVSGLFQRATFEELAEDVYLRAGETGRHSAMFVIALENFDKINEHHGQTAADTVIKQVGDRLLSSLRPEDHAGQLGEAKFAFCLAPSRQLDLESCIQKAGRIMGSIEEPIQIDGIKIYLSASIGFCQFARAPGTTSAEWIQASVTALREATRRGPSAIRAFSDQMRRDTLSRTAMIEEVGQALECGHIQPWFQPQISTDTGQITGFEALARWSHPTRGMIAPAEFLPAIEQADLLERLAEMMMYHAFTALKAWDGVGLSIPQVGVNFAGSELSNPHLLDKIKWELDRFELTPDRLAVEVLETVVASAPDDMITRNINALGEIGCRIDLDDFGTGNASIASIRRFSVSRIKIDKSFVMKADRDPDQQRMISAILTMAERLGVETLAEGVETVGEHVLLAQLGCDHVQGYGIARAMPFEQTLDWIAKHNAKLEDVPRIMNKRTS